MHFQRLIAPLASPRKTLDDTPIESPRPPSPYQRHWLRRSPCSQKLATQILLLPKDSSPERTSSSRVRSSSGGRPARSSSRSLRNLTIPISSSLVSLR